MFENKINGSFSEELKSVSNFVKKSKDELKRNTYISKVLWITFSILIAIVNITILILSFISLKLVTDDHYNDLSIGIDQVWPTASVAAVAIFLFILSIVIAIYQGVMKGKIYRKAAENIQYLTLAYETKAVKLSEQEFKTKINKIVDKAKKHKSKQSYTKAISSTLVGGNNE